MANGEIIMRSVGFAVLRVDKSFTIDGGVFAAPGNRPSWAPECSKALTSSSIPASYDSDSDAQNRDENSQDRDFVAPLYGGPSGIRQLPERPF